MFYSDENLINGEARIYAQIARLALLLDDHTFASKVITEKILTDRISDKNDPRYGQIGVSTASLNDAEAWNILESTLTLCLEAKAGAGAGGNTGGGELPHPDGAYFNPITTAITIDGNLQDWANIRSFGVEEDDLKNPQAKANWLEAWFAHNEQNLYVAYKNKSKIDQSKWWLWEMYLDTDRNKNSTGFIINDHFGAEYVLQGSSLYKYAGSGLDWKWTFVKTLQAVAVNDSAEIVIPKSLLDNDPKSVRSLFFANNMTYTGSVDIDIYTGRRSAYFFSYNLKPASPCFGLGCVIEQGQDLPKR
jgi:hypothetical protein